MPQPKVVIVVLNYCRWKETVDCLDSLKSCLYPNYETIVVDNSSPDESVEKLRAHFPHIEIVQTDRNVGYTGGVNVGMREALKKKPEFILLLNEDTLVTPKFLDHLVNALIDNPMAGAACGTIYYYPNTTKIWYAGGEMIPWRGLAVHRTHLSSLNGGSLYPVRVSFVTGCLTMVRVSAIEKIGFRDERFFMSLEDIEYSARILNFGYDLLYVPEAVIYHRIPVKNGSRFNLYYSVRNRLLLIDTAFSPAVKYIAKIYFLLIILGKLTFWKFVKPEYFKAAKAGLEDYFAKCFYEGRGVTEFTR